MADKKDVADNRDFSNKSAFWKLMKAYEKMVEEKDATDDHDKKTDSIFNEAILITSTDNVPLETSISMSGDFSTRDQSIFQANCVSISTDNLPVDSTKQSSREYKSSLWKKKKKLIKNNDEAPSSKTFKHGLITTDVNKNAPILNKTDNVDPINEEFTTNSLEESNIWPALTILDQSLSERDVNTSRENHEIIEKLYERYTCSPRSFTEHLITILEETTIDFLEKSNDLVSPGLAKLLNSAKGNGKLLDDESVPEYFISSSTVSAQSTNEISTNLTEFSTITTDSLDEPSNGFTTNSTKYVSLEALNAKIPEIRNITYNKTPKIFINDKLTENDAEAATPGSSPTSLRNKTYRKTPKIVVNPGTPQNKRIANLNIQSPRENNDDDEYITADSENESDLSVVESSSTSKNETVNMSKIVFHHNEWVNMYEKVSRYKPAIVGSLSKISDRKEKISNYTNKLEKRWLEELAKKRQTCFDMVDRMLKKSTLKPAISESELASPDYKRQTQFLSTLMACSEYFTYMTAGDSLEPKTRKKKNRCASQKSPLNSNRKSLSHSRRIHNVTKKVSRKSLERKTSRINLPVTMSTNSPRRSISKRVKGATPEIDRSSIRPVRELRMIYSPRRATMGTKIPLPKQPTSKSYIPQSSVWPVTSKASNAVRTLNIGGPRSTKKFKHVKSPIREYIRREYKKPILFDV